VKRGSRRSRRMESYKQKRIVTNKLSLNEEEEEALIIDFT